MGDIKLILPPGMQNQSLMDILSQMEDEVKIWTNKFFGGNMPVKCSGSGSCGSPVYYKNDKLQCSQCGKVLDKIHLATVNPQENVYLKPVIDVKTHQVQIMASDSDFFPIDPIVPDAN